MANRISSFSGLSKHMSGEVILCGVAFLREHAQRLHGEWEMMMECFSFFMLERGCFETNLLLRLGNRSHSISVRLKIRNDEKKQGC